MVSFLLRPINRFRIPKEDKELYHKIRKIFGFSPRNIGLYKLALIHKSASLTLSKGKKVNNERLEYLGDAVLDAIVADYLFDQFPNQKEGFLTKMRSKIVSRASLNHLALQMGLDRIIVSQNSIQPSQKNIYGNTFEAIIGAMFLDRGYQFTSEKVINTILEKYIDVDELQTIETDYKSRIIEWSQKNKSTLRFQSKEVPAENGGSPNFIATIFIDEISVGEGFGSSKKEAEQNAAMEALAKTDEHFSQIPSEKNNLSFIPDETSDN